MSIERHLGQKSAYKKEYDPGLLVREDRQDNRNHLSINGKVNFGDELPFQGFDTWQAYEVSALTNNGCPHSFVVKLCYSSNSPYIVESKSLKLYFNSYAMTKLGNDWRQVKEELIRRTKKDLSVLLGAIVEVGIWHQHELITDENEYALWTWDDYCNLETTVNSGKARCEDFEENPGLLQPFAVTHGISVVRDFHSSSLVSCCKVTGQPDSGDVFITLEGKTQPDPASLLKYLVSFRNENHFHEEICETIWVRLNRAFEPQFLSVTCLYSRRGGIDINPVRVTKGVPFESVLNDVTVPPYKLPRQ